MRRAIPLIFALQLITASAAAGSLRDMAWLEGQWSGSGLGGRCDETWSAPDGGVMVGTFRLIRDDQPVFYEFLVLAVLEGKLTLRLKHFNPDMKGWETPEKFVEFRHVRTEGNVVEFEGLKFRRDSPDRMTILLTLKSKDGSAREEVFAMNRR